MADEGPLGSPERSVVRDALFSETAGGAFVICDASGRRVVAGHGSLRHFLRIGGAASGREPGPSLPELLGVVDTGAWSSLFADAAGYPGIMEDSLRCRRPDGGAMMLRARHAPLPGGGENRLLFLYDDTELEETRERLARARSIDTDSSARLQAAVLVNGEQVRSDRVEYACLTMPSRRIDGDFMDVLRLEPGCVDVLLGDVMGKGMEAAILGTVIKLGLFRSIATMDRSGGGSPSVKDVCAAAERGASPHLLGQGSIATLAYLRLREADGLMEFVDCGHTPIVHYSRAEDACRLIKGADMPLGFVDAQDFRPFVVPYEPGDVFLVFSDGLSECPGPDDEAFGEERVSRLVRTLSDRPASEIAAAIVRLGFEFSASGFADDVSLVCVKALPAPADEGGLAGSLSLSLGAQSKRSLGRLRTVLERALKERGSVDAEENGAIVIACLEAAANIAEHALGGGAGRCRADWRIRRGVFSVCLSYDGPDYDWLSRASSPIMEYGPRGYGLGIIQAAMDSALLCAGLGERKTLVLVRRLRCPLR
ncbi:MAG TPA: SpoIIE family protein phosphatase [Spirochaetia bacterium]|nr:SpoIIE family protein phosphatase [Spirochaetia bacterium]